MVSIGKVKGVRKFKSFSSIEEAQRYKAQLDERHALDNEAALSELDELGKAAIRHAMAKLKPFDATLNEAVDFFLKFGKPPKGKITIQEAMDLFKTSKTKEGDTALYIEKSASSFFTPFKKAFGNCYLNEVSPKQAYDYIYNQPKWNSTTKGTHLTHLRTLYNFAKDYAPINPFKQVPSPKKVERSASTKILTVDDARNLLQYALDRHQRAECAAMTLVLFCGVRVEEVRRIDWEMIHLETPDPFIDLSGHVTKNGRRRINHLPANAVEWLNLCKSKGLVSPNNYTKRMQRLRKKAKISYPQNAARHSFASYHIAISDAADKTALMLGHQNPQLLYRTYREVVRLESARLYWKIIPKCVEVAREAEIAQRMRDSDDAARIQAEEESNCGRAIKDEAGKWIPVQDMEKRQENIDITSFQG